LSTHKLLIMEYIEGINVSDIERLRKEGYDLKLIAQRGAEVGFRSALEYGFFHADPHPGNLLVLPGNVLCLLDYGMMGTISARDRERLGKLLYFLASADEKRTARALLTLIESTEVIDAESLEIDVSKIIQEFGQATLQDVQLGNMLPRLLRLLQDHHARFPTHMIWLFKTIATMEDISRKIDPQFELLKSAKPYASRLLLKDLNPVRQARETYLALLDSFSLLSDLPYDASVVVDQLKRGKFKIEFQHVGLDPMRRTLVHISHNLSLTILLSSLLVASSLIVLAGVPPIVWGLPVIGLAGFIISGILTVILIITIIFE
jgi:ubiquinone biosynthesis protein